MFPGGRVDPEDYEAGVDPAEADAAQVLAAARQAAARETSEEAGLAIDPAELVWFAHWTPDVTTTRRYATWFFAGRAPEGDIVIDDGEIRAFEWVSPGDVIARHRARAAELLPPTWMTLTDMQRDATVEALLARFSAREPAVYVTKIARDAQGVRVAMWGGDAGYDSGDPELHGTRHRLRMLDEGWELDRS